MASWKGEIKPTTIVSYHPLLVFFKSQLPNGEDITGSQLWEELSRLNIRYRNLNFNAELKLYRNFNAEETVQQLDLVTLFNVIQASHHLDIQSLMDLSCRSLVKKVDGKRYQEIINKIDSNTENVQNYNDTELISSILRKRGEEVLIDVSSFWINMPWSPFVASFLSFVERRKRIVDQLALRMMNLELDMENKELEEIVHDLYLWIVNEPELANRLDAAAFVRLLHIVKSDISCTQLKCWALKLLGFAVSETFKEVLEEISFLVKLLIKQDNLLRVATLYTLMRLAVGSSDYKKAIIDNYALEEVLKISNEGYQPEIRFYAAKFLVVVCRGSSLPSKKVEVARDITVNILKSEIDHSTLNYKIVFPCYALQYLSYNEPLEMGEILLRMLIKFLWSKCTGISGSALGVVGNIVRVGKDSDIEFLISHCKLLECLGTILVTCICKKFRMEACQIFSNIAARNKTSREEMAKANMVTTLCSLLEKDDSDVKMEVAWAILNGIYGNRKRQIDVYLTAEDYYENI
ncbi:hypothetical protein POM88_001567 [Heracleum sosnowskyi]|uniref:Uncharacterized protein n=1 Tax=Heracleum sosnowskyi TaxID=360622 RepID=A0AAD8JCS7_9APIA|nr:hypothetical protein POM88_001567 [Heracleum sosnowskyi]